MYCGFALKFTVGASTKEILYTIGVHQGDNLAPLLFNIIFKQHWIPWNPYGTYIFLSFGTSLLLSL
eukprot:9669230-Ditylum_brightwellii.AAC.1